jgi:formylglycine-generating enzyme required for sulfatase activity
MVLIPGAKVQVGMPEPREQGWHLPLEEVEIPGFCMDRWEYPNVEGELPLTKVTWAESTVLCRKEGKRLCSSAEWEFACRGAERRLYVYGNQRDEKRCNTPIEGGGQEQELSPPLAPHGSYPDCITPEGVQDLNGSVSEWVSDSWPANDGRGPPGDSSKPCYVLRGGTMWNLTFYGQDCTSHHSHPVDDRWTDDGLRCCATLP